MKPTFRIGIKIEYIDPVSDRIKNKLKLKSTQRPEKSRADIDSIIGKELIGYDL
jgi:hypothetical protein